MVEPLVDRLRKLEWRDVTNYILDPAITPVFPGGLIANAEYYSGEHAMMAVGLGVRRMDSNCDAIASCKALRATAAAPLLVLPELQLCLTCCGANGLLSGDSESTTSATVGSLETWFQNSCRRACDYVTTLQDDPPKDAQCSMSRDELNPALSKMERVHDFLMEFTLLCLMALEGDAKRCVLYGTLPQLRRKGVLLYKSSVLVQVYVDIWLSLVESLTRIAVICDRASVLKLAHKSHVNNTDVQNFAKHVRDILILPAVGRIHGFEEICYLLREGEKGFRAAACAQVASMKSLLLRCSELFQWTRRLADILQVIDAPHKISDGDALLGIFSLQEEGNNALTSIAAQNCNCYEDLGDYENPNGHESPGGFENRTVYENRQDYENRKGYSKDACNDNLQRPTYRFIESVLTSWLDSSNLMAPLLECRYPCYALESLRHMVVVTISMLFPMWAFVMNSINRDSDYCKLFPRIYALLLRDDRLIGSEIHYEASSAHMCASTVTCLLEMLLRKVLCLNRSSNLPFVSLLAPAVAFDDLCSFWKSTFHSEKVQAAVNDFLRESTTTIDIKPSAASADLQEVYVGRRYSLGKRSDLLHCDDIPEQMIVQEKFVAPNEVNSGSPGYSDLEDADHNAAIACRRNGNFGYEERPADFDVKNGAATSPASDCVHGALSEKLLCIDTPLDSSSCADEITKRENAPFKRRIIGWNLNEENSKQLLSRLLLISKFAASESWAEDDYESVASSGSHGTIEEKNKQSHHQYLFRYLLHLHETVSSAGFGEHDAFGLASRNMLNSDIIFFMNVQVSLDAFWEGLLLTRLLTGRQVWLVLASLACLFAYVFRWQIEKTQYFFAARICWLAAKCEAVRSGPHDEAQLRSFFQTHLAHHVETTVARDTYEILGVPVALECEPLPIEEFIFEHASYAESSNTHFYSESVCSGSSASVEKSLPRRETRFPEYGNCDFGDNVFVREPVSRELSGSAAQLWRLWCCTRRLFHLGA